MKIGFNSSLEKRMDAWIKKNGGLEYLLHRAEIESLYREKSKLKRTRRIKENG